MNLHNSRQVGINVVSLWPAAIPSRWGLRWAWRLAKSAGYDYLQILPMKCVTELGLRDLRRAGGPYVVRFREPAWNPTTFLDHVQGHPGGLFASGRPQPTTWADVVLFPSPKGCEFRGRAVQRVFPRAEYIGHAQSPHHTGLVEVSDLFRPTLREVVAAAAQLDCRLVLDTKHLRAPDAWSDWHDWLPQLVARTNLLHVQAVSVEEWNLFMRGEPNELADLLREIFMFRYAGEVVVEVDPRHIGFWGSRRKLRLIREQVLAAIRYARATPGP